MTSVAGFGPAGDASAARFGVAPIGSPPIAAAPPAAGLPSPAALAALAGTDPALSATAYWSAESTSRLLARLCAAIDAQGAALRVDRADGRGQVTLAEHGNTEDPDLLVPVPLSRPWRGELALSSGDTPNAYAGAIAALLADRLGLALENDRLRRADLHRQAALTFLAEASELLAQSLDVDLTMALIPRLVVPRLGEWCAVYAADEWGDPVYASATHTDEALITDLTTDLATAVGAIREAMRSGLPTALPAQVEGFALPLIARGQRLGALVIGRPAQHRHDADEMAVVQDVARRAALALDNARIHAERRQIAQTLQQSLLPPALPVVPGVAFGAEYVPTLGNAEVGGDFYDVVPIPDGRWLVVVGDVSGKGVQAATVTGLVRDVIRVLVRDGRPLADMLARINETLVTGATAGSARWCWRPSAGPPRPPSTSSCTWPATTGRYWWGRTARRPLSVPLALPLGCSRWSRRRAAPWCCPPATLWSSTPTG